MNERVSTFDQGVPHASTEDGVYRGFFIPKGLARHWISAISADGALIGSVMVANTWFVTEGLVDSILMKSS